MRKILKKTLPFFVLFGLLSREGAFLKIGIAAAPISFSRVGQIMSLVEAQSVQALLIRRAGAEYAKHHFFVEMASLKRPPHMSSRFISLDELSVEWLEPILPAYREGQSVMLGVAGFPGAGKTFCSYQIKVLMKDVYSNVFVISGDRYLKNDIDWSNDNPNDWYDISFLQNMLVRMKHGQDFIIPYRHKGIDLQIELPENLLEVWGEEEIKVDEFSLRKIPLENIEEIENAINNEIGLRGARGPHNFHFDFITKDRILLVNPLNRVCYEYIPAQIDNSLFVIDSHILGTIEEITSLMDTVIFVWKDRDLREEAILRDAQAGNRSRMRSPLEIKQWVALRQRNPVEANGVRASSLILYNADLPSRLVKKTASGQLVLHEEDTGKKSIIHDRLFFQYSAHKFGDLAQTSSFAKELAELALKEFGKSIMNSEEYVVVAPPISASKQKPFLGETNLIGLPSAIEYLAEYLASALGIEYVQLFKKRRASADAGFYSMLNSREARAEHLKAFDIVIKERDKDLLLGKKVLFVDDLLNTGATEDRVRTELIERYAVKDMLTLSLIKLKVPQPETEELLQNYLLTSSEGLSRIVQILNEEGYPLNIHMLKRLFKQNSMSQERFTEMLRLLSQGGLNRIKDLAVMHNNKKEREIAFGLIGAEQNQRLMTADMNTFINNFSRRTACDTLVNTIFFEVATALRLFLGDVYTFKMFGERSFSIAHRPMSKRRGLENYIKTICQSTKPFLKNSLYVGNFYMFGGDDESLLDIKNDTPQFLIFDAVIREKPQGGDERILIVKAPMKTSPLLSLLSKLCEALEAGKDNVDVECYDAPISLNVRSLLAGDGAVILDVDDTILFGREDYLGTSQNDRLLQMVTQIINGGINVIFLSANSAYAQETRVLVPLLRNGAEMKNVTLLSQNGAAKTNFLHATGTFETQFTVETFSQYEKERIGRFMNSLAAVHFRLSGAKCDEIKQSLPDIVWQGYPNWEGGFFTLHEKLLNIAWIDNGIQCDWQVDLLEPKQVAQRKVISSPFVEDRGTELVLRFPGILGRREKKITIEMRNNLLKSA